MKGLVVKVIRDDLDPSDCDCCGSSERWVVLLGQKLYFRDGSISIAGNALTIGQGPDRLGALLDASATLKYLVEEEL